MDKIETLPAGQYYVGDLCYVLKDGDTWAELCNLLWTPGKPMNNGVMSLKDGRKFSIFSTAYGDGVYLDGFSNEYCVDSGTLGCVLISDIREDFHEFMTLGHTFDFDQEFVVGTDGNSVWFAYVTIDTNPVDEDDEYEEDYE